MGDPTVHRRYTLIRETDATTWAPARLRGDRARNASSSCYCARGEPVDGAIAEGGDGIIIQPLDNSVQVSLSYVGGGLGDIICHPGRRTIFHLNSITVYAEVVVRIAAFEIVKVLAKRVVDEFCDIVPYPVVFFQASVWGEKI